MAKETEFNPTKLMEIPTQSKIGKLVNVTKYEDFETIIKTSDNVADLFGEVEKQIAQKLETGKDIKRVVDSLARPLKDADERLRDFLTQFMLSQNISRFDGKQIKSITLQDAKTTKGVISKKQIMVKRKYVDIDTLSKDDLIEMLEQLGVKTRIDTVETETTKPASIRVQK